MIATNVEWEKVSPHGEGSGLLLKGTSSVFLEHIYVQFS